MGDEWRAMMLALDVDPMGGGDWRWRWYDHDSDRTLADGVEGDVVAAWRAATTHYVKSSNELLWSLDDRAEAAEQRAEDLPDLLTHLRERLAQARAEGEAAGAARERADVVAMLRNAADESGGVWMADAADGIEAGEHVGAAGGAR